MNEKNWSTDGKNGKRVWFNGISNRQGNGLDVE